MSDKRISSVLVRQRRHMVRDATAVVLLAVGLGLAALMVAFHLPSTSTLQSQINSEPSVTQQDLSPARATAKQISEIPPWQ